MEFSLLGHFGKYIPSLFHLKFDFILFYQFYYFHNDWFCFSFPTGLIAALQTDEKYYGKGYGGLVLRYLSKMIAVMGYDVYAGVLRENAASLSLFRRCGFKIVDLGYLIKTKITWTPADEWRHMIKIIFFSLIIMSFS